MDSSYLLINEYFFKITKSRNWSNEEENIGVKVEEVKELRI